MELDSNISEAWLNGSGTVLAVVGAEDSSVASRSDSVKAILKKKGVKATELEHEAHENALKRFVAGTGWYHGAEVDRLSHQEAEIIAARIIRLVEKEVELSNETAKSLKADLAAVFKRRFTRDPKKPEQTTERQRVNDLVKVAKLHLDEDGIAALKKAAAKCYRPLAGEKYEAIK